jgi:lipopolysaccharide transport system permease protein
MRDIAAQYRQSALGYLWAVVPAVFTTLIWVILQSSRVVTVHTGGVPYVAYVLVGTTFWQLFVDALNSPLKQVSQNRSLLNRVNFPAEALLASGIVQVLFSLAIRIVVLVAAFAIVRAPVHWTAVFAVLPIFGLLVVGTVIGVLLVPVGVLYRDVEQALPVVVTPLMFLTPVVYPVASGGTVGTIMRFNPLTPMFAVSREFLFGGVGPYMAEFAIVCAVTALVGLFGWLLYRLSLPILIERLEA